MPIVLIASGIVLVLTSIKGNAATLFGLLQQEFTPSTEGGGGFLYWALAVAGVGSVGFIKTLRPVSQAGMALIIIVLFLHNGGFFTQLEQGLGLQSSSTTNLGS